MADLSQQVRLQNELNEAIRQRNALLEQQNKLLSNQSDIAGKISQTVANPSSTRRIRDMTNAIRSNNDAIEEGIDHAKELEDALDEAADAAESSSKSFNLLGAGFSALKGIMSGGVALFKNVGSAILNIGASLLKTAFSIISFPFKLFGSLVEMAQQGGGGRPLAEAYEEVRDVFGDLSSGPGKTIISTFKQVRKEGRNLAQSGVSIRNIFGYGREGRAAMLKDLNEIAGAMGDNFHRLESQFASMGSKNIIFQRGLAMSKEEYGELTAIVQSRGQNMEEYLTEFSKTAQQTAGAFGIGVKDMAKGMKELALDVETFGHLGPKAFAPITAYARKLGLEIKAMAGVMDKFSSFEDAQKSSAQLAQAFGMQLDHVAMLKAENPAEVTDMLRESFFKAGLSLQDLNRHQRKYLGDLTNLKGANLEAAFAADKQGLSYASISKNAKKAQKSQKSQKEVLQDLGKGIKRLIQTMSGPKVKGFFDSFVKGFETGILRSKDMRGVFRDIRRGLRQMRHFGIRVGKTFMRVFPGIKDILGGIRDLLRPENFTQFISKLEPALEQFFEHQDFGVLVDKLSEAVGDGFGGSGAAVKRIGQGLEAFLTAASSIIASFLGTVIDKLVVPALNAFGRFMTEVEKSAKKEKGPFAGIKAIVKTLMKKVEDGLGDSKLGAAIMRIIEPFSMLFKGKNNPIGNLLEAYENAAGPTKRVFSQIGKDLADAIIEAIKEAFNNLSITDILMGAGILGFMMNPIGFVGGAVKLGASVTKGLYKGGMAAQAAITGARGAKSQGLMGRMLFGRSKEAAIKSAEKAAQQVAEKTAKGFGHIKGTAAFDKQFVTTYNNSMRTSLRNIENGTSRHLMRNNPFRPVLDAGRRFAQAELPTVLRAGSAAANKGRAMKEFGQRMGSGAMDAMRRGVDVAKNSRAGQGLMNTLAKIPRPTWMKSAGGFAKKIPIIGTFVTGLFATIDAAGAKEGERSSTFLSSVVSSLGFGVFDTDEVHDAFFGSTRKAEQLYEKQGIMLRGKLQEEIDKMVPKLNEFAAKIRQGQADMQRANQDFIDAMADDSKKFTDEEIAAEEAARKAREAHAAKGTTMVEDAKSAAATLANDLTLVRELARRMDDQVEKDSYGDIDMSFKDMSPRVKKMLYMHIAGLKGDINRLGKHQVDDLSDDLVLGPGGTFHIADDYVDEPEKVALLNLEGFAKKLEASRDKQLAEADKFVAGQADFMQKMKESTLKSLLSSATKRGDAKLLGQVKGELKRRAHNLAMFDKDVLELQMRAMSPYADEKAKTAYQVALKKAETKHYKKLTKIEKTVEQKNRESRKKLSDLQLQKRMLKDIKALESIPKQLKQAKKALAGYDLEAIKTQVKNIVKSGNKVIDSVAAGVKEAGGVSQLDAKSKAQMKSLNDIAKTTQDFAGAFKMIDTAAGALRHLVERGLMRGMSSAKLEGKIHDFAIKAVGIREAVVYGLESGLSGSTPTGDGMFDLNTFGALTNIKMIAGEIKAFIAPIQKVTDSAAGVKKAMSGMPTITSKSAILYANRAAAAGRIAGRIAKQFDTETEFTEKLTSPMMGPKLLVASMNLIAVNKVLKNLRGVLRSTKRLSRVNLNKFKDIGVVVNQAVTDLSEVGELVMKEEFKNVKPIVDGLANFGGGKVTVSHNLPNAKINLNVRIDSKRFAKQLVKTPLKVKAVEGDRYISTGAEKTVFAD